MRTAAHFAYFLSELPILHLNMGRSTGENGSLVWFGEGTGSHGDEDEVSGDDRDEGFDHSMLKCIINFIKLVYFSGIEEKGAGNGRYWETEITFKIL